MTRMRPLLSPPHWLTVRVGRDDPHSAAAWYVDSEADVAMVLESMLQGLGGAA